MRTLNFSRRTCYRLLLLGFMLCLCPQLWAQEGTDSASTHNNTTPQNEAYYRRHARMQRRWKNLIPSLGMLQYAGDQGIVSAGLGWDYGKRERWESHCYWGYIPRYDLDDPSMTFTFKEVFTPWSVPLGKSTSVEPLTCSMFLNSIFDEEYWVREPDRYPRSYYRFSSKVRVGIGVGQRFTYKIPERRRFYSERLSVYYELSTCDLYLISSVPNKYLNLGDIIRLGLGIQLKFL